jgi:hypothetical protein
MTPTDIGLIWKVAGVVFACGVIYGELKAIRKDIARLSERVQEHNTFDRRIIRLETMLEIQGQNHAEIREEK